MAVLRRTNVADVLNPMYGISTLFCRIYSVPSRVALDSTHVEDEAVRFQSILKSVLVTSSLQIVYPLLSRPFWRVKVITTTLKQQRYPSNCSITFSVMTLMSKLSSHLFFFSFSFFILKRQTIEQVQCDMQCDVYATCDMNHSEQQTDQRKGCLFLIRSLNEGLDVRVAVGTHTIVLAEAHTSHMDDLCITRMVALVTVGPPSLRAVVTWRSYFFQVYLLGVVVLRRAIASTVSMSEMHPHLMVATLSVVHLPQRAGS